MLTIRTMHIASPKIFFDTLNISDKGIIITALESSELASIKILLKELEVSNV